MDTFNPAQFAHERRQREDGWTPQVMEEFIINLVETGSVRKAAMNVERHVTTAYRLRARNPAFAKAWDAARRMAYSRLRDEAMERIIDGTFQQVWKDGQHIDVKRVWNDRLLMNMLNHLKHEEPRGAMRPRGKDEVEDGHSDEMGEQLDILALLPPPESPRFKLWPDTVRVSVDTVNGVALV